MLDICHKDSYSFLSKDHLSTFLIIQLVEYTFTTQLSTINSRTRKNLIQIFIQIEPFNNCDMTNQQIKKDVFLMKRSFY